MNIDRTNPKKDFDKIDIGWWWFFCCVCDIEEIKTQEDVEYVKTTIQEQTGAAYDNFNEAFIGGAAGMYYPPNEEEQLSWATGLGLDLRKESDRLVFHQRWGKPEELDPLFEQTFGGESE